jgi:hypothetical protein
MDPTPAPVLRRLTYRPLGDAAGRLVGHRLGCDAFGLPYVVVAAEFYGDRTVLVLAPDVPDNTRPTTTRAA